MKVTYFHSFVDEFLSLDSGVRKQLWKKLEEMSRSELETWPHQALQGKQFRGLFKLRVGDWRLIYRLEDDGVAFVTLGHRSEVYG